ncbi:hypothetical protein [Pseudonocardia sp. D17]|uniref:hypothetical protein n=1 Tax=Pseudonocardia sp. D17 TaxID=882661 RepID=UPI0030CC2969
MRTWTEARGKRVVARRSGGWCETCDLQQAHDWHHRLNRSQGGTWAPSNGLHVCRPCHDWIGLWPVSALERGWHLEPHEDPRRARVWLARHGWSLLHDSGDVDRLDVAHTHHW